MEKFNIEITIPGLLIIDTPGHEAFYNLRARGGAAADFAILVIDVIEGFQTQTWECINILKSRRVPFLVAANKIDRIPGWKPNPNESFLETFKKQSPHVQKFLDEKIYEIVGSLSTEGFQAERLDRVKDFARTVAIIPTSGKTGEGIPELLAVLAGLAQRYMKKRLTIVTGPGKGVVLEVREEPGLGLTLDAIIYDGVVRKGDLIVVGGLDGVIVTKIRSLLQPKPLDEIRDPRERFDPVNEVVAAAGVKIVAPDLEGAVAGSPIRVVWDESTLEEVKKEIEEELEKIRISTDKTGVILKADTLGSLEAIVNYFKERNIPIRIADVGDVSKRDVMEAIAVRDKDPFLSAILAFNVKVLPDAEEEARKLNVPIFKSNIIYRLFNDYEDWLIKKREEQKKKELETLIKPGKIKILPGYVFRRSKPAIVGIKVLGGRIQPKYTLVNPKNQKVGSILQIQDKGQNIKEATTGMEVAVSIKGPIVGRHIKEGDILYVDVPESHVKKLLTKFKNDLTIDEIEILQELIEIKRKEKPFWGT